MKTTHFLIISWVVTGAAVGVALGERKSRHATRCVCPADFALTGNVLMPVSSLPDGGFASAPGGAQ